MTRERPPAVPHSFSAMAPITLHSVASTESGTKREARESRESIRKRRDSCAGLCVDGHGMVTSTRPTFQRDDERQGLAVLRGVRGPFSGQAASNTALKRDVRLHSPPPAKTWDKMNLSDPHHGLAILHLVSLPNVPKVTSSSASVN
ncbi:hypothetical protein A4X13_0g2400, partial [Tilletia indica]